MACCLIGAKPLSEPMLTYYQLNPKEHISMKSYLKFKYFHSRKYVWKCCLRNAVLFISAPMCQVLTLPVMLICTSMSYRACRDPTALPPALCEGRRWTQHPLWEQRTSSAGVAATDATCMGGRRGHRNKGKSQGCFLVCAQPMIDGVTL